MKFIKLKSSDWKKGFNNQERRVKNGNNGFVYFLNSRFINPSVYNVCREGDLKMDKICEYCEGKGYDYEK